MKRLILFLAVMMLCSATASAQTTVLSEDFENGSGTSLSNWTFVNGSQTNQWYAGTATAYSGSRSAYITNNGGTSNSYSIGYSSVVHLYRDVYLPAGNASYYVLSFNWKGSGESGYDYLDVFLENTTVTPVAGVSLSNNYATLNRYNGYSSWQQTSIILPSSTSTKRLIFSWRNDGSDGSQPPAAIDNITITAIIPVALTVNLTTAGTLKNENNITMANKLTLTGNIDARDIRFMRDNMPLLSELDISGANIIAYSGSEGTSYGSYYSYPANEMPRYSFVSVTVLTSITLPNSLITIENYAFEYCSGLTSVTIPNSVITIGEGVFYNCSGLMSVSIGNSVTMIGDYAFYDCANLTSVTIPNSVTTIGYSAFKNCAGLASVFMGNSVTTIGDSAFMRCSGLTDVIIGNSVTTIGFAAFQECSSLTSITIPPSVQTIGGNAFVYCSGLRTVYLNAINCINAGIDNNTNTIYIVFYSCPLFSNLIIGNNVQTIPSGLFYRCNGLTSVTIPNSVTSIGDYAFSECNSLTSITIPNSVISIGYHAFSDCSSLTSVTIPNSVTSIGNSAFSDCSGLTEIYVKALNPPTLGSNAFYTVPTAIPVHILCGRTNAYRNAYGWSSFSNYVEDISFNIFLQSNNALMGTAYIIQPNTCDNNVALIGATPNINYRFVYWSDGNSQSPRSVVVTQDTSFTAIFATATEGMYYVSAIANHSSMGSVSGSGEYALNAIATITATPNSGYQFVQWNDNVIDNPRTLIVTSDMNFIATFDKIKYTVAVSANFAERGIVNGYGTYEDNTVVSISAMPNPGFRFLQWDDGNTQNPRTVIVTQNTSFTAIFAVNSPGIYYVFVKPNDPHMGMVSGSGDFPLNTNVPITASPNSGYRFVKWNDGNMDMQRIVTVTQDITYTAMFEQIKYRLTVVSNHTGMGDVSGNGEFVANTDATITAIPYPGYRFVQWNDGDRQTQRIITVTCDTAFVANFDRATSIAEVDVNASGITVYPNPATDKITVTLPENVSNAVFTLYDMQGKALIQQSINNQDVVSVSDLVAGIYIYSVRTEKVNYQGKIGRK
jgi:hypothetical protein